MPETQTHAAAAPAANAFKLILAWAFVGIPALWGVAQVVAKALALFR